MPRPALRHGLLAALLLAGIPSLSPAEPLPKPRPSAVMPAEAAALQDRAAPLPKHRPARPEIDAGLPEPDRTDDADGAPEAAPRPAADPPPAAVDAGAEVACRWRLKALGVTFEEMEPIDDDGACGAAAPVSVSELAPGISLSPAAILNCRTAEALAKWVQEEVVPAAERHLDAEPTGLLHASSYVCRPRNNRPGAKLSEHALANAIDIAGIAFAEREAVAIVARSDDEAAERAFQRAIREGACEHFTTVLGPGSNAAHATHFHFDMAQRKRGYRLCE
jgi:hypothetical protein